MHRVWRGRVSERCLRRGETCPCHIILSLAPLQWTGDWRVGVVSLGTPSKR